MAAAQRATSTQPSSSGSLLVRALYQCFSCDGLIVGGSLVLFSVCVGVVGVPSVLVTSLPRLTTVHKRFCPRDTAKKHAFADEPHSRACVLSVSPLFVVWSSAVAILGVQPAASKKVSKKVRLAVNFFDLSENTRKKKLKIRIRVRARAPCLPVVPSLSQSHQYMPPLAAVCCSQHPSYVCFYYCCAVGNRTTKAKHTFRKSVFFSEHARALFSLFVTTPINPLPFAPQQQSSKSSAKGPVKRAKRTKRAKKDPNKPKGAMSAFMQFSQKERPKVGYADSKQKCGYSALVFVLLFLLSHREPSASWIWYEKLDLLSSSFLCHVLESRMPGCCVGVRCSSSSLCYCLPRLCWRGCGRSGSTLWRWALAQIS